MAHVEALIKATLQAANSSQVLCARENSALSFYRKLPKYCILPVEIKNLQVEINDAPSPIF